MDWFGREEIRQLRSKLMTTQINYMHAQLEVMQLRAQLTQLRINQQLQKHAPPSHTQFTPQELRKLIQLCHPDKHAGSPLAAEMTSRLLQLKG